VELRTRAQRCWGLETRAGLHGGESGEEEHWEGSIEACMHSHMMGSADGNSNLHICPTWNVHAMEAADEASRLHHLQKSLELRFPPNPAYHAVFPTPSVRASSVSSGSV